MTGKGKRRRSREQSSKGNNGVSPSEKRPSRVSRTQKNVMQRSISEWLTDDDITDSHISPNDINITPLALLLPLSDPEGTLSPILSRPRSSEERSKTANISCTPPISETLNLSAGAASLRKDLATCEKIMTEKHEFLVEILGKMNNGVSSIENKLIALETGVQALEDNEHKQTVTAQNIFHASNEWQNDLEKNKGTVYQQYKK